MCVEVAMEQLLLSFLGSAREITRAERFGRSAPGRSASFRKEVHSLEGQPLPPCRLCQEGKQGRGWGFVRMARREQEGGRERGGTCKDSSSWVSLFEMGLKCVLGGALGLFQGPNFTAFLTRNRRK